MKLKGLVWFFTIALIVISLWELSYTWAVRSYEKDVRAQAERIVKKQYSNLKTSWITGRQNAKPCRPKRSDPIPIATQAPTLTSKP